jgi:hypothetical protein
MYAYSCDATLTLWELQPYEIALDVWCPFKPSGPVTPLPFPANGGFDLNAIGAAGISPVRVSARAPKFEPSTVEDFILSIAVVIQLLIGSSAGT